jgi:hypothetical protein
LTRIESLTCLNRLNLLARLVYRYWPLHPKLVYVDLPTKFNRHSLIRDDKWFAPQLHLYRVDSSLLRPAQVTVVFNLHSGEQPQARACILIIELVTAVYIFSHLYSVYMAYRGFSSGSSDVMCLYSFVGQLFASASNGLLLESHDIEAVGGYLSAVELLVVLWKKNLPRNSQAYDSRSKRLCKATCGVSLLYAAGYACAERIVFDRHLPIEASLWTFFVTALKAFQALVVLPQVLQTNMNARVYHIDVIGIWGRLFAIWVYTAVLCLRGEEHACRWQVFVRDGLVSGVLLLQFYWLHRHGSKYK